MHAVYSERHRLHDPKRELVMGREVAVFDKPARAEAVADALREDGDGIVPATEHGLEPIRAVHEPDFVRYLQSAWTEWTRAGFRHPLVPDTFPLPRLLDGSFRPTGSARARSGYYAFDTATPLLEGTFQAAVAAVDCALTAADHVLAGERTSFAVCRPPGHHAGRDFYGGYCFFNNSAITAAYLRRAGGGRVAMLDLDFHHGNGSQQIFWDEPSVLTVSLHGDPERQYPYFTGRAEEQGGPRAPGSNSNFPLPAGLDDDDYIEVLERAASLVANFAPTHLVVPLGLDTYREDPLGDFALTTDAYERMGRVVGALGLPTVGVLEGGYDVKTIGANVAVFLRGMAGRPG